MPIDSGVAFGFGLGQIASTTITIIDVMRRVLVAVVTVCAAVLTLPPSSPLPNSTAIAIYLMVIPINSIAFDFAGGVMASDCLTNPCFYKMGGILLEWAGYCCSCCCRCLLSMLLLAVSFGCHFTEWNASFNETGKHRVCSNIVFYYLWRLNVLSGTGICLTRT